MIFKKWIYSDATINGNYQPRNNSIAGESFESFDENGLLSNTDE